MDLEEVRQGHTGRRLGVFIALSLSGPVALCLLVSSLSCLSACDSLAGLHPLLAAPGEGHSQGSVNTASLVLVSRSRSPYELWASLALCIDLLDASDR